MIASRYCHQLLFIMVWCSTLWFWEWRNDDVSLSARVIGSCFSHHFLTICCLNYRRATMHFIFTHSALHCLAESDGVWEREGPLCSRALELILQQMPFCYNTVSVVPSLNILYDKNESKASEAKNWSIHLTCRVNRKPLKVIKHLKIVRPQIKMYINSCCLKPVWKGFSKMNSKHQKQRLIYSFDM